MEPGFFWQSCINYGVIRLTFSRYDLGTESYVFSLHSRLGLPL